MLQGVLARNFFSLELLVPSLLLLPLDQRINWVLSRSFSICTQQVTKKIFNIVAILWNLIES